MAMNRYAAPIGTSNPFQSSTFPGAPAFGTPAGGGLASMAFPVSNGPGTGGGSIGDFATAVNSGNRNSDWNVNGQVAQSYVITPNLHDEKSLARMKDLAQGQLCFVRNMKLDEFNSDGREDPKAPPRPKAPLYTGGTSGVGERMVEAFELTQLNQHLSVPENSALYSSAKMVAQCFPLLGVVLTDVAPMNDGNWGSSSRIATRVMNFVVRGRCRTFNLWASDCAHGSHAYFIIKKAPNGPMGKLTWCLEPFPSAAAGKDHSPFPQTSDLCWIEDGKKRIGLAIYVGTLGESGGEIALDSKKELWKQGLFANHFMPPTTEIFIRV